MAVPLSAMSAFAQDKTNTNDRVLGVGLPIPFKAQ
jgi:hypothetical protein